MAQTRESNRFFRSIVRFASSGAILFGGIAAAQPPPETENAAAQEFPVDVNGKTITVRVLSPPSVRLAKEPALLITFAVDRTNSLTKRPYSLAAEHFLAQGHRAASFDLPGHGDRIDQYGDGITGMRNAFVAGHDPFATLVEEGKAVISECIKRGLATPGRIAVAGTSRGGYMALRLLAGDDRIAAGAGFAPVTDWRELTEFAADKEREDVRDLQLANFATGMLGKHVYIAIGKTDARVGTGQCKAFADDLAKANAEAGNESALVEFHLTEDQGHSCGNEWYERGRAFLLRNTEPSR